MIDELLGNYLHHGCYCAANRLGNARQNQLGLTPMISLILYSRFGT